MIMNLVQEPRDTGLTEDEDFNSADETESSFESDHETKTSSTPCLNLVHNDKGVASTPAVQQKVAYRDEEVQKQAIATRKRVTLSRNPVKTCVRPVYPQRITLLSRQTTGFTTGLVDPAQTQGDF